MGITKYLQKHWLIYPLNLLLFFYCQVIICQVLIPIPSQYHNFRLSLPIATTPIEPIHLFNNYYIIICNRYPMDFVLCCLNNDMNAKQSTLCYIIIYDMTILLSAHSRDRLINDVRTTLRRLRCCKLSKWYLVGKIPSLTLMMRS